MDVIGVGGINFDNQIAKFSSRGMTTWVSDVWLASSNWFLFIGTLEFCSVILIAVSPVLDYN